MQVSSFIADSAAHAVEQIRRTLGPKAVVLNVRPLPASGLSRFWQKKQIEVLACVPSPAPPDPIPLQAPSPNLPLPHPNTLETTPLAGFGPPTPPEPDKNAWRVGPILEKMGLLPVYSQKILEALAVRHRNTPPRSMVEELAQCRDFLIQNWRQPASSENINAIHAFIGPPGTGKTNCLCKWLTQSVLLESRSASVWRLDGPTANTAESLTLHGEILGVPVERAWTGHPESPADRLFIDLPGVPWTNPAAIKDLSNHLKQFSFLQLHLVLNAAYETPILLSIIHAFSPLPITDLIFTHLDEESRWGKLWNFVLGTNYPIRFLSAGQNIPGDFLTASPEKIFSRQSAAK